MLLAFVELYILTVLTDVVEFEAAVSVGPEPALGAVEAGAVLVPAGQVPEADRHGLAVDPLPVLGVVPVTDSAQPVLAVGIALKKRRKRIKKQVSHQFGKSGIYSSITHVLLGLIPGLNSLSVYSKWRGPKNLFKKPLHCRPITPFIYA